MARVISIPIIHAYTVIGYSTILEEDYQDKFDDEAKKLLTNIRHKALRMDTLVNDLLHFSHTKQTGDKKNGDRHASLPEFLTR